MKPREPRWVPGAAWETDGMGCDATRQAWVDAGSTDPGPCGKADCPDCGTTTPPKAGNE